MSRAHTVTYHSSFQALLDDPTQFDTKFRETEWPKLSQAAEVHGYRGASKKKHNGIVPIRPTDKGLLKTLSHLVKKVGTDQLPSVAGALPVKAVAHVPSGNRLVGYLFASGEIVFFGVANYAD